MTAGVFGGIEALLSPQTLREAAFAEIRQAEEERRQRQEREAQLDARREELLGQAMQLRARERGGIDPTQPAETFAKPIADLFAREQLVAKLEAEAEQRRWESERPTVLYPETTLDVDIRKQAATKRRLERPLSEVEQLRVREELRKRRRRGE